MKSILLAAILLLIPSTIYADDGVILIFAKPNCEQCDNLIESIENKLVQASLKDFEIIYVDVLSQPDIVKTFGINIHKLPLVVIGVEKNKVLLELDRSYGYKRPNHLIKWLSRWKLSDIKQ